jgi:hypothetical protein
MIEYCVGSWLLRTQWPAVTAHSGEISEAPHVWLAYRLNDSCHGHEFGTATSPPTIRAPAAGLLPHVAETIHESLNVLKKDFALKKKRIRQVIFPRSFTGDY